MAGQQISKPKTRIQRENEQRILEGALNVFSVHGFRGSTIDLIATESGMSKPNLLYYFPSKEAIHRELLQKLLRDWLGPLTQINPKGAPLEEIRKYIRRKIALARDYPQQSRLFAIEVLRGAPHIMDMLGTELKQIVDQQASLLHHWMQTGQIRPCDPYHLIFSIWSTTQHYADFNAQVTALLPASQTQNRFDNAARFLETLFIDGLRPQSLPHNSDEV